MRTRAAVAVLVAAAALAPSARPAGAAPASCDPGTRRYVCALYDRYLHPASEDEVTYWVDVLTPPEGVVIAREQVVLVMLHGIEGRIRLVGELYRTYLDRAPDAGGMREWVDVLDASATPVERLEVAFLLSPEYLARFRTQDEWVRSVYEDVLGRAPSNDEVRHWSAPLVEGRLGHVDVARSLLSSEERRRTRALALYAEFTDRVPSPAEVGYWAMHFANSGRMLTEASFLGTDEVVAHLGTSA